ADGSNGPRYHFLQTIRQYAVDKLETSDERMGLRNRYLEWFLDLAGRAEPELAGSSQSEWLARLETEMDNLRSAFDWALPEAPERALELSSKLWRFWYIRGHLSEGRRRLEDSLQRNPKDYTAAQASPLSGL